MFRLKWGKVARAEVEDKIKEELEGADQAKKARLQEAAKTPEIREQAMRLQRRGETNHYGESLMLAWGLRETHGHG